MAVNKKRIYLTKLKTYLGANQEQDSDKNETFLRHFLFKNNRIFSKIEPFIILIFYVFIYPMLVY